MRVVIWGAEDITADDTGMADAFVRCFMDQDQIIETDTHFRCQDTNPNWNYRLLFDLEHPRKDYNFSIQLFDKDFFTPNKILGETSFDLKDVFVDTSLTKRPLVVNKSYWEYYMKDKAGYDFKWHEDNNSFWVVLKA